MKRYVLTAFTICIAFASLFAIFTPTSALAADGISATSLYSGQAEADPTLHALPWPRTLIVTYCWGATEIHPGCDQQAVTLFRNRTAEATAPGYGTVSGTWSIDGNTKFFQLDFTLQDGSSVHYEATKRGRRYKNGTMTAFDSQNNPTYTGVWEGILQR